MNYSKSIKIIFINFLAIMVNLLSAQELKSSGPAQRNQPIDLIADKGFYDQEKGIAIYEGNVVVTQEGMVIWSDKLTIVLDKGEAKHIEAETYGDGRLSRFEYKGKAEEKLIKGHSKRIDYEVAKKIVTLTTKAMVTQEDDKFTGDKLTYNLNNENIGGSKVKMTFNPTKKK